MPATPTRGSVLILEPESSGVGLIGAARRLGFEVQVFDRRPPHELPDRLTAALARSGARYTRVESQDGGAVLDAAVRLAAHADLAAVVPGFEYAVEAAAQVSAKLGLPGLDPATAGALRDKIRMKRALGPLAPAAAVLVADRDDGTAAAASMTYPAVVKPVDGSGSLLVRRVDSAGELRGQLAAVRAAPVDDMGRLVGRSVLVEPYVEGPEFSVEGFVADGRVTVASVTEKRLGPEPHFVELVHVVDAALDCATREALRRTAVQAVQSLRITVGAFHLEARLGTHGPVVIEVAGRLGGDLIPDLVARVHGRDMYDATVRAFAGLPIAAAGRPGPARAAAARFFTVARETRLDSPNRLAAEIARIPGCEQVTLYPAAGGTLRPATDFRQRFGHVLVTAADREELESGLAAVERAVARHTEGAPCAS